jgi:hypothetical protein
MGRFARPEDVAGAVAFLADPEQSAFVNGHTSLCGRRLVRRRRLGEPEAAQATAVARHRSDAVGGVLSPREYLGTPELCDAVPPVELAGVPGGRHPPPQALQVEVGGDHSDEPPPDSASLCAFRTKTSAR